MNKGWMMVTLTSVVCTYYIVTLIPTMSMAFDGITRYLVLSIIPFFIIGCIVVIRSVYLQEKSDAKGRKSVQ